MFVKPCSTKAFPLVGGHLIKVNLGVAHDRTLDLFGPRGGKASQARLTEKVWGEWAKSSQRKINKTTNYRMDGLSFKVKPEWQRGCILGPEGGRRESLGGRSEIKFVCLWLGGCAQCVCYSSKRSCSFSATLPHAPSVTNVHSVKMAHTHTLLQPHIRPHCQQIHRGGERSLFFSKLGPLPGWNVARGLWIISRVFIKHWHSPLAPFHLFLLHFLANFELIWVLFWVCCYFWLPLGYFVVVSLLLIFVSYLLNKIWHLQFIDMVIVFFL